MNVFVAFMPAEAHFESVWWIGMLQGVLLAAVYMCLLAKEIPVENHCPLAGEMVIDRDATSEISDTEGVDAEA